jgi:hypothetical protein
MTCVSNYDDRHAVAQHWLEHVRHHHGIVLRLEVQHGNRFPAIKDGSNRLFLFHHKLQ